MDGIRRVVQDLVVPELRELGAEFNAQRSEEDKRLDAMDKRLDGMDKRLDAMDKRLDAMDQKADARHAELLAALRESRAAIELTVMRDLAVLRERIAVLETRRN